jgi:hypothetical protein
LYIALQGVYAQILKDLKSALQESAAMDEATISKWNQASREDISGIRQMAWLKTMRKFLSQPLD